MQCVRGGPVNPSPIVLSAKQEPYSYLAFRIYKALLSVVELAGLSIVNDLRAWWKFTQLPSLSGSSVSRDPCSK